MLERLAAWFLNTYVADYVGNVDTDQLSIGLLKGAVELEKLPLKKDALRKLKLPFDIKSGYIGKLRLVIPVRSIKSAPWVIQIDQLYVVAGPAQPDHSTPEEEEEREQAKKASKLSKMEEQWRSEQQKTSSWWYWSPISFTFPSNVIANLQVIVNDVHIRYEDAEADPSHPFSVGLLLENLSAQSTDEYWEPKFTADGEKAWKLVDLQNLSVYFDHELLGDLEGPNILKEFTRKRAEVASRQDLMTASSLSGSRCPIEPIIRSVSGQAKLTRNLSKLPLKMSEGPRINLEVQLEEIPIVVSDEQYSHLVTLLSTLRMKAKAFKLRKWWKGDKEGGKKTAIKLWNFALGVTLGSIRERNVRHSVKFAVERARQNVAYVEGYMRHLTEESLPEELRGMLKEVERVQSYEELLVLRKIAMRRVEKERSLAEAAKKISSAAPQPSVLQSWFPGWLSSQPQAQSTGLPASSSTSVDLVGGAGGGTGGVVSDGHFSEEDELLNELGYEETDNIVFRDRIFLNLNIFLVGGSFQLVTTPPPEDSLACLGPEPLVEATFAALSFSVDLRPRFKYCTLDVSLGSLSLLDHSDSNCLFPILIQPRQAQDDPKSFSGDLLSRNQSKEDVLFAFKMVAEEVNHQRLYQFKVHSRPLDIIYKQSLLAQIKEILMEPLTDHAPSAGSTRLDSLTDDHSRSTLSDKLGQLLGGGAKTTSHRIMSVKMDISAPSFILPRTFVGPATSMVVLDLGHVTFGNVTDWSDDEVDLGTEPVDLEIQDDDDDDDEFQTPPSSPGVEEPNEQFGQVTSKSVAIQSSSLRGALHSLAAIRHLQLPHERYLLRLTDLQISVGKVEENEGHWSPTKTHCQHLIESFTLSMKIQRLLKFSEEAESPTLYLAADLPYLKFQVDEHKINTVLSCLNTVKQSSSDSSLSQQSSSTLSSPRPSMAEKRKPQDTIDQTSSLSTSMYHSAMGSILLDSQEDEADDVPEDDMSVETAVQSSTGQGVSRARRMPSLRRRYNSSSIHQRLLIAVEKQIKAELSVSEVQLSLSSKGRLITELKVPQVKLEFLKRPYDVTLRLVVQDLYVVDRIHAFGPEHELMLCSSYGKNILSTSPIPFGQDSTGPSEDGDHKRDTAMESISSDLLSDSGDQDALLTLRYKMLKPLSPFHPAIMEVEELDEEEDSLKQKEFDHCSEPIIHRVNIQCTCVEAVANQETLTELVSFFKSVWPESQDAMNASLTIPLKVQDPVVIPDRKQVPLQTEVKVTFEKLVVRMLKAVRSSTKVPNTPASPTMNYTAPKTSGSGFFTTIMLCGLTAEGKISTDISISGRMKGVRIRDVTAKGKNYPDILVVGTESEINEEFGSRTERSSQDNVPQCLSFSLDRSPHSSVTGCGAPQQQSEYKSDVHLSVFVPAIHYLHSVNFVYEMELFVMRIVKYLIVNSSSLTDAAVDVAKGLVGEKTQLTKGLSRLHSSFGHAQMPVSEESTSNGGVDEADGGMVIEPSRSRFFFNVLIQSPVIVLPAALYREECLVAHLGEVKASNEYAYSAGPNTMLETSMGESMLLQNGPQMPVERMTFIVSNISLHATETSEGRRKLEEAVSDRSLPDNCCKVLKEAALSLCIEKRLKGGVMEPEGDGGNSASVGMGSGSQFSVMDEADADFVITGRVCDPLTVQLPKKVFDQIRTTLKHGVRKKPRRRKSKKKKVAEETSAGSVATDGSESGCKKSGDTKSGKTVRFHPDSQTPSKKRVNFPKVRASFTLPKLSLELKHLIDSKDRDLVYVSLEELSAKYQQNSLTFLSVDVSLKSILIEDLLQAKDSDYRNILCSSSTPYPRPQTPRGGSASFIHNIPRSSFTPTISRHLYGLSPLMSTPRPQSASNAYSPLRSFNSNQSSPPSSSQDESESRNSTLRESQSSLTDLLTVQAFFVGNKHPLFKEKFDSTSLHADVDFNSVFVIINLQTWVLLLDFLGIGVPTPPPSRPSSPDLAELEPSADEIGEALRAASSESGSSSSHSGLGVSHPTNTSQTKENKTLPGTIQDTKSSPQSEEVSVWGVEGKLSLNCKINVKSLSVTFNKYEHPLAKGSVTGVSAQIKLSQGNMEISGALGQGSVIDMTETGAYYRERFTTTGEKALTFKIFKYGRPDPLMERPYDILAKVKMASVRYLHTMRFLKEILAFISHFPQLIDAFQRMKANAEGKLDYAPGRKARISFDVNIDGPVLLIPKHAFSPDIIVGDIGRLILTNSFCYEGQPGTITFMREKRKQAKLNMNTASSTDISDEEQAEKSVSMPMLSPFDTRLSAEHRIKSSDPNSAHSSSSLHMVDAQLKSTSGISSTNSIYYTPEGSSSVIGSSNAIEVDRRRVEGVLETFKGPCLLDCLDLSLESVDVFSACRVPDFGDKFRIVRQKGKVLKEKGAARLYIERNLYEDFCRNVPDLHIEGTLQAIHVMLDKPQLELIKGLVEMNLGETIEDFEKPSTVIRDPVAQPMVAEVWTGLLFRMQFVEVQMEFLSSRKTDIQGSRDQSLARFDILESEFTFESCSNQHKTVDLSSNAVIGYDTRYEGYDDRDKPSVFEEVLRPTFNYDKNSPKNILQVEIHVVIEPKDIKASILLNKLRLMAIFDVILELKNFIFDKPEESQEEDDDEIDAMSPSSLRPTDAGTSLRQKLVSTLQMNKPEKKNPRNIRVKLSVTETDFVVLEDTTAVDSNAVVLKGTLILTFFSVPDREKLLNCSIDGLELFSCNLSNEDETALSILDPVTIALEIKPPEPVLAKSSKNNRSKMSCGPQEQIFGIEIQQLNFRLSYNDIKLFLAIAQSLPSLSNNKTDRDNSRQADQSKEVDGVVLKQLLPLGFSKSDILKELHSADSTSELAIILHRGNYLKREDSVAVSSEEENKEEEEEKKAFSIKYIQVHIGSLSVCLIDDCVDNDVPLLDFSLADLQAEHDLAQEGKRGRARALFAGDYYNRHISAWEPVLESWMCELNWSMMKQYSDVDTSTTVDRLQLALTSKAELNVNVTSSLIHILRITQASWTRDIQQHQNSASSSLESSGSTPTTPRKRDFVRSHYRTASGKVVGEDLEKSGAERRVSTMEKGLALLHSVRFVSTTRQRSKFVPFMLRNNTGLPLKFATKTSVPSKVYLSHSALLSRTKTGHSDIISLGRTSEWYDVEPGQEIPFDFITRKKNRHRDTRDLVVHQLLVKVSGWQCIETPVSVDKIGVFFREVQPSFDTDIDVCHLPPDRGKVRLVFAISLDEVQKVVNVRSPLVLRNMMEVPLEIKLEPTIDHVSLPSGLQMKVQSAYEPLSILPSKGHYSVPLHLTSWDIYVRPQHWGVKYCNKHLTWKHLTKGATPTSHTRSCDPIGGEEDAEITETTPPSFRFCFSVQRENYPVDVSTSPGSPSSSASLSSVGTPPAHTLTLYPPLTITNLLPSDIQFSLWSSNTKRRDIRQHRRLVSPGQDLAVYSASSDTPVELDVAMEGFERCQGCLVNPERAGVPQSIVLEDCQGRPLRLNVTTDEIGGWAIKVSISCSYWLINRTGLPLVFKQEGMSTEAAGQHKENEGASTTTPLLFSYSEGEFVEKCSMRLGREFDGSNSGMPKWCAPFGMISDCGVCRVFVRGVDGRPDQEFQIGVDIQRGRGRYRHTRIVTFVAHYQLENRTHYKLAFLQRHQLKEEEKLEKKRSIPTILPGAILPFHWPRTDFDQLLCLRVLDIHDSSWSGGFVLDKDSSFHLNIRSTYSYSAFIRCQVTLRRATFHIVFSDASRYPPPFRLENLSQTSIVCYQVGTKSNLTLPLNPGQSVPYAWDEQTLPEVMCVEVKGGGSLKLKLEQLGDKGRVIYESYFYIVAYATFPSPEGINSGPLRAAHLRKTTCAELVLDVPQGTAVIFQRKDPNRRTQLWRMSAARKLVHIASSDEETYVLDIAGGRLPGPGQYEPLVLRKESTLRAQSQTWVFKQEGTLIMEKSPSLCVQSRLGLESLREGADAVLGVKADCALREQQIRRIKHSPGSGVLSVSVLPDGPTRILRVTDQNKKYSHTQPRDDWIVVENGQVAPSTASDVDLHSMDDQDEDNSKTAMEIEVCVELEGGVGVSLINSVPEELVYAILRGVKVQFVSSKEVQNLAVNIQHIQVDNKLAACYTPVMAYPTPPATGEPTSSYPVLKLNVNRTLHKSPHGLVFKMADFHLQDMTVIIEERLLFKILQWAGIGQPPQSVNQGATVKHEISDLVSHRAVLPQTSSTSESLQVYFEQFNIGSMELRVSVFTTSQLPDDLKAIKYQLGFPLVKFESPVKLRGFCQSHMIGDVGVYVDSLVKHYKRVVKAQAIKILGSVDFLGNPVGLVSDVASGVSGMISSQPDVVGLVRDVTHGMSDTTSKLTGTVSHVLGKATFDTSYQEEREQIFESCRTSGDHLKAGLMGLSGGLFGGMTSLVTQPLKDTRDYGITGLFSGLAKGVVGTVAKPVAGLFDFASETSAAIRESTSRVSRQQPPPIRHTRCCLGANGALTTYSTQQARGQEYLLRITDGRLSEKLVSYEKLYENPGSNHNMRVIISSQYLYFFQSSPPDSSSLHSQVALEELESCKSTTAKTSIPTVYIVLNMFDKQSSYNAPKYRCSDEKVAIKVAQLINYAKNLYEEEKHIVTSLRLQQGTVIW